MKQIRLSGWVGGWLPGIKARDKGTATTVHIRTFINLKARHVFLFVGLFFVFFVFLFISLYMYRISIT